METIYSKTSTILDDLPSFDMGIIAGLITAMDIFFLKKYWLVKEIYHSNKDLSQ